MESGDNTDSMLIREKSESSNISVCYKDTPSIDEECSSPADASSSGRLNLKNILNNTHSDFKRGETYSEEQVLTKNHNEFYFSNHVDMKIKTEVLPAYQNANEVNDDKLDNSILLTEDVNSLIPFRVLDTSTSKDSNVESDSNLLKSMEGAPIRPDQFNKVSPFDDVPGFKKNLSKNSQRKKMVKTTVNEESVPVDKESSLVESSVGNDRRGWIQFEESADNEKRQSPVSPKSPIETSPIANPSSQKRTDWVLFETASSVHLPNSDNDDAMYDSYVDIPPSEMLLENSEPAVAGSGLMKGKSIEDLLDAVNKTVTTIKESISQTNEKSDEKQLVSDKDDDNKSDISDEVISLDYESEEENKKLRDTPIKKFTDVSLFQASSAVKTEQPKPISNGENRTDIHIDEEIKKLDDYPPDVGTTTWEFWYRYPDRKKRIGTRCWLPVSVVLEGDFIRLTGCNRNGTDIVKEIPLHPFFVFTIPTLHTGDKEGSMHSVKLQYVKYEESRKLQRGKWANEHMPSYTPVVKLASRDILELKEFINRVEGLIRTIPTYRDKGITYRYEEIFIDCDDDCQFLMSGDGHVLLYNITVQMRLRVFVTGNPELKLFLNDFNNKEILSKTKESLLRDIKPSCNWINPQNLEYHPCVDELKTQCEGGVIFSPPDGCSFELLRFRVHKKGMLPLICKSSLELLSNKSIRLQATVQVKGDAKTIRYKRNDVKVYFPIPSSWGNLFVKGRSIKGVKQYLKVKSSNKSTAPSTRTNNRVTIHVSAGEAYYEPAFGAILWKVGSLPFIHGSLPADVVHSFQCYLELPFVLEMRDDFEPYSYVEFNIAYPFASGVSVEEVLLSDGKVPDKWVCYRANYLYKISMKLIEDGKEKANET